MSTTVENLFTDAPDAPAEVVALAPVEGDDRFKTLASDTAGLLEIARAVKITDEISDHEAKDLLAQITRSRKRWDELRRWFVDPLNAQVKAINARFKQAAEPVEAAEGLLRAKVNDYAKAQIEAARKAAAKQAAAQQRRVEKAEAAGHEVPLMAPTPIAAPAKSTRTESGTVGTRRVWRFEIVNVDEVPREWLQVNEKAIGAAVKAGLRQIPGVRIFEDVEVTVR